MPLVVFVLIGAVLVGYLAGGRLRRLEDLRLRWWGLAPLGLALQFVPLSEDPDGQRVLGVVLLIASYPVLLAFASANIRLAGFVLIVIGLALNLTVIAANQGMPVTRNAIVASGQGDRIDELPKERGAKHFLARPGDVVLEPLADVIPIGSPVNDIVSVGDCVLYAGVFWLVVAGMRGRPVLVTRRREAEPARS
jgi:hypothetical protein